jgi:hypothetical protein
MEPTLEDQEANEDMEPPDIEPPDIKTAPAAVSKDGTAWVDDGDGQIESNDKKVTDVGTAGGDDGINVETVPDPEAEQARLDAEMDSQYGERTQEHKPCPRHPRD